MVSNKRRAINIDDFIDTTKKESIDLHPDSYCQHNWLRFKKDENVTEFYGDGDLTINDNTLAFEKKILELPFAASETSVKLIDLLVAAVLRIKDGAAVTPQPRILLPQLQEVSNPGGDGINLTSPTLGPVYNLDLYNGYFLDNTQGFSMDGNSILVDNYLDVSALLNAYKKVTGNYIFSTNFINQLDLFNPVFSQIYNSYFIINKIASYQPGKSCAVELIRI